jgi:hypothetical protein
MTFDCYWYCCPTARLSSSKQHSFDTDASKGLLSGAVLGSRSTISALSFFRGTRLAEVSLKRNSGVECQRRSNHSRADWLSRIRWGSCGLCLWSLIPRDERTSFALPYRCIFNIVLFLQVRFGEGYWIFGKDYEDRAFLFHDYVKLYFIP